MALDINSMLLQPTRLNPNQFDMGEPKAASMERERLKLMREQFEETKRQHQQELEYNKLAEQGRMAREQMQSDRQAASAKAAQDAEVKKQQDTVLSKFTELNGQGDIEGARAMVPLLTHMGLEVNLLGEENGLPSYQIGPDPEAAQRAAGGIGYPGTDSTPMQQPLGIQSTGEAFGRALAASRQSEETGEPALGPDEPDYTGAVPKNVIDTGAIQQQTLARLNPALAGIVGSYPQEYRDSAEQTAGAVRALGMPAAKSIETFDKLRGGPNSLIQAGIAADATRGEQSARRAEAGAKEAFDRRKYGTTVLGEKAGELADIGGILSRQKARSQATYALNNETDADDEMVGAAIARDMGDKGVLSNQDIKIALGTSSMSFLERLQAGAFKQAIGGLSPEQKKALNGLIDKADKEDRKRAMGMLDSLDGYLDDPGTDPDVKNGIRDYRKLVPKALRDEHDAIKKRKAGGSSSTEPQGFNMEADANAEFGRTPEGGGTTIPQSSRIAFEHNNPGNLKFADQEGATQGEEASDGGHWAKFPTVEAGMEALRQQVMRDSEKGLTVRQFVTKYAPPGSNDTETYIAQAAAALKAKPDDALAETDPYDVVRFVAKKESGTEMPDQYTKSGVSPDEDPVEKRIRELEKKAQEE